jgi:hypothetical protein
MGRGECKQAAKVLAQCVGQLLGVSDWREGRGIYLCKGGVLWDSCQLRNSSSWTSVGAAASQCCYEMIRRTAVHSCPTHIIFLLLLLLLLLL